MRIKRRYAIPALTAAALFAFAGLAWVSPRLPTRGGARHGWIQPRGRGRASDLGRPRQARRHGHERPGVGRAGCGRQGSGAPGAGSRSFPRDLAHPLGIATLKGFARFARLARDWPDPRNHRFARFARFARSSLSLVRDGRPPRRSASTSHRHGGQGICLGGPGRSGRSLGVSASLLIARQVPQGGLAPLRELHHATFRGISWAGGASCPWSAMAVARQSRTVRWPGVSGTFLA